MATPNCWTTGTGHLWDEHPVQYRPSWPATRRWVWMTCKRCGAFKNMGAKK